MRMFHVLLALAFASGAFAQRAAPAKVGDIEIPAGTVLSVRLIDGVDSEKNQAGQTFRASLVAPVMVDGYTAIPRGADVLVKLVEDDKSGKFAGHTELKIALASVKVNGRMVDINTDTITRESQGRGGKTAKKVAGGAGIGSLIGAIAGGGKGAGIGAASGAGAGAAAQVLSKRQRVKIPAETRLTFTLESPVQI